LSYSGHGAKCTPRYGHLRINRVIVWESEWCRDLNPRAHNRGLAIFLLDPFGCSVPGRHVYDTHQKEADAAELTSFLNWMSNGTIIIGVTANEAVHALKKALPALSKIGVDVGDVHDGGSFGFIAQKGFPQKTVLRKVLTEEESNTNPAKFYASVTGTCVQIVYCKSAFAYNCCSRLYFERMTDSKL